MQAVEITAFLDGRISDLVKSRLPDQPAYPFGDPQYASFMPREDMSMSVGATPIRSSSHKRSGSGEFKRETEKVGNTKQTYRHRGKFED
jgi:hypothetical protein